MIATATATDELMIDRFGQRLMLAAPVVAIVPVGDRTAFVLGNGTCSFVASDASGIIVDGGCGAILCASAHPDGQSIVVGGDTGRAARVAPDGATGLGNLGPRWIDHIIASAASGAIIASVGKEVIVWEKGAKAPSHRFEFPSTVGGLALDAKGKRLAVAHYGGVSLVYPSSATSGRVNLAWAGSHIACTMRPEGDFVVTGTQETGLHGWRMPLGTDMMMSGYRGKTRSFSWNRRGKWLATSGDEKVVIWPFDGKNGPMGRAPLLIGARKVLVTQVAFHPRDDMLAVGYADGAVALIRIEDDAQMLVERAGGGAITALAWNGAATTLAFGDEDGRAGLLDAAKRG